MPSKDRPLVDRHAPKDGEGWLLSTEQQKVCRFRNDMLTAHAKWVVVESYFASRWCSARGEVHASAQRSCSLIDLRELITHQLQYPTSQS